MYPSPCPDLALLRAWAEARYWAAVRHGHGESKSAYSAVVEAIDARTKPRDPNPESQ